MAGEHTLAEPKIPHHDTHVHLHTHPNQCPYQLSTFRILWNPINSPDTIIKLMVTMTRSNQGHRMMLHTYSP